MDSKNLIIIEKIKSLYSQLKSTGVGKKYPPAMKVLIRELFINGMAKKEIARSIPVSMFTIRKWTADIEVPENNDFDFSPISIKYDSDQKYIIRHVSGFSIEVNDLNSLSLILMKIKSL
ncbi:MAG: hypothetical protein DRQ88_00040 [Epsilonproteobacteria bacterium]|nr:MAG: hypothetical protein DRQ88_00040 [Campylobacterota bacterium]